MQHAIKRYPVRHPLLKNYVKFFWEIDIEQIQLFHKLIPQRNINLRFNLSDTPHFITLNGKEQLLDDVFFSGLQDHFINAHIKLHGRVHILGVCFLPEGFFPFLKIPVSEFKNQMVGTREVGFKLATTIREKLMEAPNIAERLNILEDELAKLFCSNCGTSESFRQVFNALKNVDSPLLLSEFCQQNSIGMRTLERMYNKHVGISAKSFITLNRFQNSLNQILRSDYSKLSDVAFDNGYFDQMHFIKDFKRFAGNTPKGFVTQSNSILQIGKFK